MQVLLFSAIAGICGTGFGGLISAIILKRPSERITCWLLAFAAGVMTSIVCFGLIPEAIAVSGVVVSASGLIVGVVVIMVLNRIVDRLTETAEGDREVHYTHEGLYHEGKIIHNRIPSHAMLRSGTIMLVAIGLHNIPEGLAIGAGGSHDIQLGALLAIMIALHNIPEGMAIAAPLLAGGVGRWKVVALTALAGSPTLLGGIIGVLIGSISDLAIAMSLAAAGGAMLYVVFGEIIPQSVVMTRSRIATIITLFGLLVGLIIAQF